LNSYCTLFDAYYLTRGLALYRSLEASGEDFELIIYCFDARAHELLLALKLERARLVTLEEFETPALLSIKSSRTRGEYCWTCTPHVIRDALDRFRLSEVTYLDADLFFFKKAELLLEEFRSSDGSVLLTEHRYTPKYDQTRTSGVYCVQFVTFKNDSRGLRALEWWQERCIEWCYARIEDGKFGDQKYLDDWTSRFEGVHVLRHLGGGVAPWNVQQYQVSAGPQVDAAPVVFYHFHRLGWYGVGDFSLCQGGYLLSDEVRRFIYEPYLRSLEACLREVRKIDPQFGLGFTKPETSLRARIKRWLAPRDRVRIA